MRSARALLLGLSLLTAPAAAGPPAAATPPPGKPAARSAAVIEERPKSWTDPQVVRELEKSCAFDPDKIKDADEKARWLGPIEMGESSPLSCQAAFDQSCVYDPCWTQQEDKCKPACTKACLSCGAACVAPCEACKQACTDGACKTRCAQQCAACHETCVRQNDRCSTGTCTEEYKRCGVDLKKSWKKNNCKQVCRTYTTCAERCGGDDYPDEKCQKRCKPKADRGCDLALCQWKFGMGIDLDQSEPR